MSRRERRVRWLATAAIAIFVCASPASTGFATSDDPTPVTSPDSAPETTETTTETTRPDTADAADTADTDTSVVGEAADDDATSLTWIAIVAAIALLSVAVWWMVRSTDRGGPIQPMDDDWPDRSEVI